jgi:hypothetical protein
MNRGRTCLLVLIALTGIGSANAENSNLLRNSSFEAEGSPDWGVTGTVLRVEAKNWHPRTGRWSFGIGNDEGPWDGWGGISQEVDLPAPALEGQRCYLSVWLMAEAQYTGIFVMSLEFLGADGQQLRNVSRPTGGALKERWQMARIMGVMPAGATRVRVVFASQHMRSGTGQSYVWIDDASLKIE